MAGHMGLFGVDKRGQIFAVLIWSCSFNFKEYLMTKRFRIILIVFSLCMSSVSFSQPADNGLPNGYVETKSDSFKVWSLSKNSWVSVEAFWSSYVDENGGLTWKQSEQYPPYSEVKEFDTFLVEVSEGLCLMEFFHSRWRRANDVRRWDDAFNEYGGCPTVFD